MRNVLARSIVYAGAALFAAVCAAAEAPVLSNPFIAFDSGLKRGEWSPEQQAALLKELGYEGIVYKHPHDMARRLEHFGEGKLLFHGLHTGVDLDREEIAYPELEAAFEQLRGTECIIWPTVAGTEGGDEKAVQIFRRMGEKAGEAGLKVAIYPHDNTYIETAEQALRIVEKVGLDNVGVSLNLCHELKAGNGGRINEILDKSAPHLFLVQISGAVKEGQDWADEPWSNLVRPLDSNEYDLVGYLEKLVEIGYDGPICLMPYGIPLPPREHLSRSMAAWEKLRSQVRESSSN